MNQEMGFFGALLLALDIYAIYTILQESWSGTKKVVWILIVLLFPLVGMFLYFAFFRQGK